MRHLLPWHCLIIHKQKRKIMQVELDRSDVHPCRHVIVAVATSEFIIIFLASKNISYFL